nr:hypothetical protein [Tanacetum cinerariifolium]
AKILIKGVFVNDPCEKVSSNGNRGYCQLGFGQQHIRRLGRGDWYCSGGPIRIEEGASWDLDNSTWGGWGEVIGTVPVDAGAQESSLGEMG